MIDDLIKQLRRDEGEVLHAYHCSEGWLTIGIGRLIDQKKGGGITREEAAYLLGNDIQRVSRQLQERLPWAIKLSEPRLGVLMNMAFQLGIDGLLAFRETLRHVQEGRYEQASVAMLDSKWARQTPERARRLAEQMRVDAWM